MVRFSNNSHLTCVSTHSHPKVAAEQSGKRNPRYSCFNTQPPEGGCVDAITTAQGAHKFQHTATRRWLHGLLNLPTAKRAFQHTATRRWLHAENVTAGIRI